MYDKEKIIQILKKHGVFTKKKFGQNFLFNETILDKIIKHSNIKDKDVIEIGPGIGVLTKKLIEVSKTLTSFEIDENMIEILKEQIPEQKKFKIIEGNFLDKDLKSEIKKTIVANIPYNITSPILFKIFKNHHYFDKAILMVQDEIADKLTSKPNDKKYSNLTISCQLFGSITKILKVEKEHFWPEPKVNSALIMIDLKLKNDYDDIKPFLLFVKQCFQYRRKMLTNNLKKFFNIEKIYDGITKIKKEKNVRAQELSLKELLFLYNTLTNNRMILKYETR